MSSMDIYREQLTGNSYTREEFIKKYKNDPSTKHFMWEKLRGLDLAGLSFPAGGGGFGIELRGADLTGTNFSNSIITNAHFREAILKNVDFSRCDLRGAIFAESDISGANFSGARLSGANFYKATYDSRTVFPKSFKHKEKDMIRG